MPGKSDGSDASDRSDSSDVPFPRFNQKEKGENQ